MVDIVRYFFGTPIAIYTGKRQQLTGGSIMTKEERKLIEAIAKTVKQTFWRKDGSYVDPSHTTLKKALYDIKCLCEKEVDFEHVVIN